MTTNCYVHVILGVRIGGNLLITQTKQLLSQPSLQT